MLRIPDRVRLALRHSGLALLNSPTSSFWSCQLPALPRGRIYSGGSCTTLGETKTGRKCPAREVLLVRGGIEDRQEFDPMHLSEVSKSSTRGIWEQGFCQPIRELHLAGIGFAFTCTPAVVCVCVCVSVSV